MQGKIIKLPDEDGMHYQRFCPKCYYWLYVEHFGDKYCPHCGTKLIWDSKKANNYHKMKYNFSIKRYKELKNGKK